MNAPPVDHYEVTRNLSPFGRVVVLRGASTDLVAMLEIERGEDGRRGATRFAVASKVIATSREPR